MSRKPVSKGQTLAAAMNEERDRSAKMAAVASRFSGFKQASQVLTRVRGVKTIFPGVDLITRIGGWPIERPSLIHGSSNEGKTLFTLGLGKSFVDRGHFFALVDAECSTPDAWLRQIGFDVDNPAFSALRPKTYEETRDAVKAWAEAIGDAKAKNEIDPNTTGIVVIDSITKLVPKDIFKKLAKELEDEGGEDEGGGRKKGPVGIDGAGGRFGQILAKLNNGWMREIAPLLYHTGTAMAIITREYQNPDAAPNKPWIEQTKTAGGSAIFYDASLVVRISLAGQVTHKVGNDKHVYGERHEVEIRKTKIGNKDERYPSAWFHSSNGTFVPAGFDTPRDYLDVAVNQLGIVEVDGGHNHRLGKKHLGRGEHATVKKLHDDPALFRELEEAVRAAIDERLSKEPGAVAPSADKPAEEPDAES